MENKMKDKTKYAKLLKAHQNNTKISNLNLGNKFTEFETSKLNESETLLYEINTKPTRFKRYARGRIVKVKFGVNIGSEFSGDHYAVVVSKGDTMFNPVLHVIPLTSDNSEYNFNLGTFLYNKAKVNKLEKSLQEYIQKFENSEDIDEKEQINSNIKDIKRVLKYYKKNKGRKSYLAYKHLKTVSKLSVIPRMNDFDYIDELKLDVEKLKQIDELIIKEYTNITIDN